MPGGSALVDARRQRADDVRLRRVAASRRPSATLWNPKQGERVSLAIRELPAAERPRERLRSHGAHALSSSELLAILLGSGSEGRSSLGIGQEILSTCRGSLRLLASQPVATLTSVHGVGTARAACIHAALELGRRMAAEERQEGAPVRWPRDVYEIFAQRMDDLA